MRLVKDGKICLDGTLSEEEKEKMVFEQFEELEDLEEFYRVPLIPLLQHRDVYVLDVWDKQEHLCEIVSIDLQFWTITVVRLDNDEIYKDIPFMKYGKTWRFENEQ